MDNFPKKQSISFDRAAEYYDATRGFPAGVAELVSNSLHQALPEHARLLETGIGTGRISLPLIERGFQVVGVDISTKMMLQMRKSLSEDRARPDLIQGDATQLPLQAQQFDAVLAVHVLHLIRDWKEAIDEARRVLKPEGSYLIGYDERPEKEPQRLFRNHLDEVARSFGYHSGRPGMSNIDEATQYLASSGAQVSEWMAAEWTYNYTLNSIIERLTQRVWSSTWRLPEDVYRESLEKTVQWAQEEFGSLNQVYQGHRKFLWRRHQWQ